MRRWVIGREPGVSCDLGDRAKTLNLIEVWGPAPPFAFGELKALCATMEIAQALCRAMNTKQAHGAACEA